MAKKTWEFVPLTQRVNIWSKESLKSAHITPMKPLFVVLQRLMTGLASKVCQGIRSNLRLYIFFLLECREYKALSVEKKSYSTGSESFTLERKVCEVGAEFIIGGTKAEKGEFPHMAAIGFQTNGGFSVRRIFD